MTRREARQQAFILLFEKTFTSDDLDQIIENARCCHTDLAAEGGRVEDTAVYTRVEVAPYAYDLARHAIEKLDELDAQIEQHSKHWKKNRLSRVVLSILRLSVYEMNFEPDVPVSVSINEAVELAKRFGGDEDASFVNGVLGSISKTIER